MQMTAHVAVPTLTAIRTGPPLLAAECDFSGSARKREATPTVVQVKKGHTALLTSHEIECLFSAQLLPFIPRLRAYALSLSRHHDRADDLIQETLFKALRYREQFAAGTNLIGWLTTILRNEHYTMLRKRREVEDVDNVFSSRLSVPESQLQCIELAETMSVIQSLPKGQRSAVLLVAALGYTCQEAADRCATKVGTIKSRLNRGRATLKHKAECGSARQQNGWNE